MDNTQTSADAAGRSLERNRPRILGSAAGCTIDSGSTKRAVPAALLGSASTRVGRRLIIVAAGIKAEVRAAQPGHTDNSVSCVSILVHDGISIDGPRGLLLVCRGTD
jgi:hypothetical protein